MKINSNNQCIHIMRTVKILLCYDHIEKHIFILTLDYIDGERYIHDERILIQYYIKYRHNPPDA